MRRRRAAAEPCAVAIERHQGPQRAHEHRAVDGQSAPAGDIKFTVKNTGTIDHEMIVLKTDTPFDQMPVVDAGDPPVPVASGADKVDEANNVGETGDPNLKPGDTRTFTITGLTPGHYVLVCNIAKHYGLGMRAAFTVT